MKTVKKRFWLSPKGKYIYYHECMYAVFETQTSPSPHPQPPGCKRNSCKICILVKIFRYIENGKKSMWCSIIMGGEKNVVRYKITIDSPWSDRHNKREKRNYYLSYRLGETIIIHNTLLRFVLLINASMTFSVLFCCFCFLFGFSLKIVRKKPIRPIPLK